MSGPLILVTADRRALGPAGANPRRVRPARPEVFAPESMVAAVRAAGGEPLLVPPHERPDPAWLDRLVALADGLVISGGPADLHPRHYGQEVLGRLDATDEGRAALELGLAKRAMEAGLPVLGICGGMQTMAVATGGSLWQDIEAQLPAAGDHEQASDPAGPAHAVRVEDPALIALFGAARLGVNSTHHQAVRDPGALELAGWADDGVVEVIWAPSHPFALGVQWHPERLLPGARPDPWAPFTALVAAARRRGAPRSGG